MTGDSVNVWLRVGTWQWQCKCVSDRGICNKSVNMWVTGEAVWYVTVAGVKASVTGSGR